MSVSQCGTFALVGSAGGSIDIFNLQSGLHQQTCPPTSPAAHGRRANPKNTSGSLATLKSDRGGHTRAVTGLVVDGLNRTVVSCGLDGRIKVSCQQLVTREQELTAMPF